MATKGMSRNPLAGRGEKRREGGLSVVGALQAQAEAPMVPLEDIAPNPDNPVSRSEDIAELVASVKEVGIVQPLLLVPANVFLELLPDHRAAVGERPWVVLAGHRRRAASLQAGLTEVPAYIRQDLGAIGTDAAMLHENLNRAALSPIEEARQYQLMIERHGLSQRDLAKHAGVSQGQVSKRLQLLRLPDEITAAVSSGEVAVDAGLRLLEHPEPVIERVAELHRNGTLVFDDLGRAAQRAERQLASEESERQAAETASKYGAQVVVSPYDKWGENSWKREVTRKADINAAAKAGNLAVAPGTHGPKFYRTGPLSREEERAVRPEVQKQRDENNARHAAAKARMEFLKNVVAVPPSAAALNAAVAAFVLRRGGLDVELSRTALPLMHAAGLTTQTRTADYLAWFDDVRQLRKGAAAHAAWVITVASQERSASAPRHSWTAEDAAYLDWLVDQGYEPTPWDKKQHKSARKGAQS